MAQMHQNKEAGNSKGGAKSKAHMAWTADERRLPHNLHTSGALAIFTSTAFLCWCGHKLL